MKRRARAGDAVRRSTSRGGRLIQLQGSVRQRRVCAEPGVKRRRVDRQERLAGTRTAIGTSVLEDSEVRVPRSWSGRKVTLFPPNNGHSPPFGGLLAAIACLI